MPKLGFSSLAHKFHDENNNASHSNGSNDRLASSRSNSNDFTHHHPHMTSRRSFLGLSLGKSSSNESSYSIMSDDHHHHHHHPNHHQQSSNNAASVSGGILTPPPMQRNSSSSMVQLKKFFRPAKRNPSNDHQIPSGSAMNIKRNTSGHNVSSSSATLSSSFSNLHIHSPNPASATTPAPAAAPSTPTFTHDANNNMIVKTDQKFWDDLEGSVSKKYGKLGKVLGSGAGGSVRLIVRESDGVTFAVKEFVARRPNESVKEYAKKCTAEFCIGSTLHHPNIIQTLDIINENNHFFEVMEYAPVDFFAVVMSGQMTRSEINCCFKQITLGVNYLHAAGLAHRDLKLDNCVVTKDGIVKLIDFGSAVVFKYPFENDIVLAHGIVGSDPYLAPEVLTSTSNYDPQYVDIWSIAIIYCCMTLRRFPWKAPKQDDPSFSLYCMEDDQPHDYVESAKKHKQLLLERKKKIAQLQKEKEEKERVKQQREKQLALEAETNGKENNENADFEDLKLLGDPNQMAVNPVHAECSGERRHESPAVQAGEKTVPVEEKGARKEQSSPADAIDSSKETQETSKQTTSQHVNVPETTESSPQPEAQTAATKSDNDHHTHHSESHQHSHSSNSGKSSTKTAEAPERRTAHSAKTQRQMHGPYRLMRLLPHAARPIISRMLSVEVSKRAKMHEILNDDWFKDIKYCTIDDEGRTINDPGHHHTIV